MPARILVIEDDPASLELVKYLLVRGGHNVLEAMDGVSGLRTALEQGPDLVLCDLQLPEMDGLELMRQLRAHPQWRAVPTVAVTAYSMPGDREATLAVGFSGYISKPITPDTFLRHIDSYLPESQRSKRA